MNDYNHVTIAAYVQAAERMRSEAMGRLLEDAALGLIALVRKAASAVAHWVHEHHLMPTGVRH